MSKRTTSWLFGLLVVGACVYTVYAWFTRPMGTGITYVNRTVSVGNRSLSAQLADTDKKRELGLGQRDNLANGQGMLFLYDKPSSMCFWMKDMRFVIDMVWLDKTKQVVQVRDKVAPDTYPTTYCAPDAKPAQYVLEVGAGQAKALGLREGVAVRF